MYEEYLRRNLICAKAEGIKANTASAIRRLQAMKKPPKWILSYLHGIQERVEPIPAELAAWRNQADDAPIFSLSDALAKAQKGSR